jgi:two-component system chemotaxis response regulator CheB
VALFILTAADLPARGRALPFAHASTGVCLARRDLIVMGGSSGALEPLLAIVKALPADLPAAVAIVVHHQENAPNLLLSLLQSLHTLPVIEAKDGTPIEPSRIYLPAPDRHLTVDGDVVRLSHGPRENYARPAVDPLFRSAARSHGGRVIGVLLSGMLDDGTAGMLAVKRRGGLTIVQEPADSYYPDMVESVLEYVDVDHIVPAGRISELLVELAGTPVPPQDVRRIENAELVVHERPEEDLDMEVAKTLTRPSVFSCPDCGGVLGEIDEGKLVRFRCHVGHAYGPAALARGITDNLEVALWTAVRTLKERSELFERALARALDRGQGTSVQRREEQLRFNERQIAALRELIDALP